MNAKFNLSACLLFVFLVIAAKAALSQDEKLKIDDKSQTNVAQLRAIAEAIKACPRVAEWEDKGSGTIFDGPPSNVVWDVKRNPAVRAPFLGTIEFFLPRQFDAQGKTCKERPRFCIDMAASTSSFHLRYEFDLGPDGLDLARLLVKRDAQSDWTDLRSDNSCWQRAARLKKSN